MELQVVSMVVAFFAVKKPRVASLVATDGCKFLGLAPSLLRHFLALAAEKLLEEALSSGLLLVGSEPGRWAAATDRCGFLGGPLAEDRGDVVAGSTDRPTEKTMTSTPGPSHMLLPCSISDAQGLPNGRPQAC